MTFINEQPDEHNRQNSVNINLLFVPQKIIQKSLPAMSKRGSVYNNDNNATSNGANRGRRRLPTNQRFRFDADCVSLTHNYEETK